MGIRIGEWVEPVARELTEHTSFAADWIKTLTVPGRYPVILDISLSRYVWTCPMPERFRVAGGIPAHVTGGMYYNAFAGNIFGSTPASVGSDYPHHVWGSHFDLLRHVEAGNIEVYPGVDWVLRPLDWWRATSFNFVRTLMAEAERMYP